MRCLALTVVLCTATNAWAYTIQSPVTDGCHEAITHAALRAIRDRGIDFQIPTQHIAEESLLDDLPFDLPDDLRDMATAAVLFGVRKPDVQQYGSVDISSLALVHGDPNRQGDHCLRDPNDDEPDGSSPAIALCQASHRESLESAAAGLNADGTVDITKYDEIETSLPIRGRVDVELNRFWVNIGVALHTTQDAYSHTFRDDDVDIITTVLNWVDYANGSGRESVDGPEHRGELDECKNLDDRRKLRMDRATQASIAVLEAMLQGDPAQRVTRTSNIFANITTGNPVCTADNQWCQTQDRSYALSAGCMQVDAGLGMAVIAGLLWRIRRKRGSAC